MFEVKKRAGCGRTGVLSGEGWEIPVPNVLDIHSERFPHDPFSEIILKKADDDRNIIARADGQVAYEIPAYSGMPMKIPSETCDVPLLNFKDNVCVIRPEVKVDELKAIRSQMDLCVLENSIELFQNSRVFIDTLVRVREGIGFQAALYLPGVALPNNLALLFYLGVDMVDSARVLLLTRQGYFLTCDGSWLVSELKGESCSCVGCVNEGDDYEKLLRHNMLAVHSELERVRARISRENLREFVEYRAKTSPGLVEMLRHLDKSFYVFQEERFPGVAKSFRATTRLSLERPDVARFRERVLSRYKKPEIPNVLLLLPCSARKPYSESKSHKLFKKAIKDSGAGLLVHEVIVTSPLGLVPRELELFYPAQHYDIPVTGHWYEDEKKLINDLLIKYVNKNNYKLIINHLGEDDLIEYVDTVTTAYGRPTSEESLDNLKRKLSVLKTGKSGKTWKERSVEEAISMARFQFGEKAEGWLDGCTIKGRYPQLRIFKGKTQVASLSPKTGQPIPTLQGAEFLVEKDVYRINIYDFELTTNLFAVGVETASQEIRAKDEVVVARNGELVATGTAQMSAREMVESDRGEAVRVRHRVKMPNS